MFNIKKLKLQAHWVHTVKKILTVKLLSSVNVLKIIHVSVNSEQLSMIKQLVSRKQ